MTRINKIVLNGFKSFAKHTEIVFGDNFNVILGPNGSGKCTSGNALVQLANGSLIRIDELVNKKLGTNTKAIVDDGMIATGDGTQIVCLDTASMKTVVKPVKAYVKRLAPKQLIKIQTRSGRTIKTTPYHPFFDLKDGEIRNIKAENLKEGVKIAVPKKINIETKNKYFYELIDLINKEDGIYVPYDEKYVSILLKLKKTTWKRLAMKIGIPLGFIKGLLDKQAINFNYLVRVMRYAGLENNEIAALIKRVKSKTSNRYIRMIWENCEDFARFLGYLLAEGRVTKNNQIWFTNGREELIQDYTQLSKRLFGVRTTINEYKYNCWDVLIYSNTLIKILSKFGMHNKTQHKTITNLFLGHSSEKELSGILNGLYSGDGYVSKNSIEITTKSKSLATAIENILTRFGINHSSKWQIKISTNSGFSGIYKTIRIYGVDNFLIFRNNINFVHQGKRKKLNKLVNFKSNPNTDLIEANELVKETAKALGINIKQNRTKFPILESYVYNGSTPSRTGLQRLVTRLFINSDITSVALEKLKTLVNSDIFWDEIVLIEKTEAKNKWVYDLCVDEFHNFIANNMFVHNSNVLDALCFVLGRMSSKSLRAETLSHLIYDGGKSKNPASKAEASIFFDNSKKTFPIEDSAVKISRIVKPSGQSVYRINDERRTRQQIIDLMSVAKIDPDGYNIILQGDVVKFVEMSSDDRRRIIEDIAGIGVYEDKKQKAMNELEKVDSKIKEAEILLAERKTHLKELKSDRDQALKHKSMSDRIKQNEATYLYAQIKKRETKKAALEKEISGFNKKISGAREEIEKLKKQVEDKKRQIVNLNAEIEQKGEQEQVKLHREVENLKVELANSRNRIAVCESETQKIAERKLQLSEETKSTEQKIEELKSKIGNLNKQREHVLGEEDKISQSIEGFKRKNKVEDIVDIESEIEKVDREADIKQTEIQKLVEQKQALLRKNDQLDFQTKAIDESIKKVLDIEKEHEEEIVSLKTKRDEFKKAVLELNKLLNQDSGLAAQLNNLRKMLSKTNEEVAKLRVKEEGKKENMAASLAVKRILAQKNSIRGIYGTIAELGTVKSKFATALETAAGSRLNAVIVQNDETAAKCIAYLKKNKLGRATFLPLNKIKPKTSKLLKKLTDAKGVQGLAIDLVSFENKFKNAFSYVFGDTLVVDSIDTARRLGIGNARMVSLDGDLAEISGAMIGGYRHKRIGSFREDDTLNELSKAEGRAESTITAIRDIEKQREQSEQKIDGLRKKKAELEADVIKSEKSLHLEKGEIDASKKQKAKLGEEIKQVTGQLEEIQTKTTEMNGQLAEIKTKKQQLREKISELRSPTLLAELNAFEQKKKELLEEAANLENEAKTYELQIKEVYSQEKERIQRVIKELEKDQKQFLAEREELNKKTEKQKKELKIAEERATKFYAKYKTLFAEKDKKTVELQKIEEKIIRREEQTTTEEVRLNNLSVKNAELAGELSGLNEEFKEYSDVTLLKNETEEHLKSEISRYEHLVAQMGNINLKALEIYDGVEKQYKELLGKKDRLSSEKNDVLKMINEVEVKKKDLFMNTFNAITEKFKECFQQLTTKGEAHLMLENEQNPFEGGVRIRVKISSNKFMDIRGLSGGEKTLTALAFIFAIQEHEPASFYILDEVDAALDKKNSEKLSELIRNYSSNAQYIMISHNDSIVSEATNLYGVSMNEHGISNVVSLKV